MLPPLSIVSTKLCIADIYYTALAKLARRFCELAGKTLASEARRVHNLVTSALQFSAAFGGLGSGSLADPDVLANELAQLECRAVMHILGKRSPTRRTFESLQEIAKARRFS
jgi:hypothetical protein